MRLCLSPEELIELTNKQRHSAQERALRKMGIECKRRSDGSVAVDRIHYQKLLGGELSAKSHQPARWEPNWDSDHVSAST